MAIKKPVALFETTISETISKSATTIPLNSVSNLTNGLQIALILDEGEDSGNADYGQEFIIGTVDTANSRLTGCLRGISFVDGITEVTDNKKKHRRGASAKMTTHPYLLDVIRALNGEVQLDADNKLAYDAEPSFTSNSNELATIKFVTDTAIAGGVDASTSAKGITKLSVAPASASNPIAVGDNDPRVPTSGQTALLAAITADAAEINVLDGLTATQAELNEAGTFFGSTNITGAEAEALTNGSNADTYHTHSGAVSYTAGETITAGEVIRIKSDGKAYRAYGNASGGTDGVVGIAYTSAAKEASVSVLPVGRKATGLSGLTAPSAYYLSDYTGPSATITQSLQGSNVVYNDSNSPLTQTFTATSSRLGAFTFKAAGGSGSTVISVRLRDSGGTSVAGPTSVTLTGGGTPTEYTVTWNLEAKKGEVYSIELSAPDSANRTVYYTATNAYAGGALTAPGGLITGDADLYMTITEYANFGALGSSAGTRKVRIGHAVSATELAVNIQYGDSIL